MTEMRGRICRQEIVGDLALAENTGPVFLAPDSLESQTQFVQLGIGLEGELRNDGLFRKIRRRILVHILEDQSYSPQDDFANGGMRFQVLRLLSCLSIGHVCAAHRQRAQPVKN
ncbi:MAG: hypothetical protein WC824_10715 [Bacteroidota bacterium]|jgi:hypothetical protein